MLMHALEKLARQNNLSAAESYASIKDILSGASIVKSAAFLALLRSKGEIPEEALGIIRAMKEQMVKVPKIDGMLDIVGTGGDGAHTVNISTGAGILAASLGVKIAKHGNRASSSLCGSADVLEKLGMPLLENPEQVVQAIQETGFGFMFAPHFHPALKKIAPIRKELKMRTIFNLIGPLVNPAQADYYLIGVYEEKIMDFIADILLEMPIKKALVVHGSGIDELSCLGSSQIIEVQNGSKRKYSLDPEKLGLPRCSLKDLQGGNPQKNASLLIEALNGKHKAIGETLALNAGAGLYAAGKTATIQEGVSIALNSLYRGCGLKKLQELIAFSQKKERSQ